MPVGSAIATAVIGAVISAGIAAATAPNIKSPDYGAASAAGIQADIDTLPYRRAIDAAAHMGGKTEIPTGKNKFEDRQFVQVGETNLRGGGAGGKLVPYVASEWQPGGKYYNPANHGRVPSIITQSVDTGQPELRTADFSGIGDASQSAQISRQMALAQLDLNDKYGPAILAQAKHELELSDPQGAAARVKLAQMLQDDASRPANRPLADELDKQIAGEIGSKGGLSADEEGVLHSVMADRGAANGSADSAAMDEMLTSGLMGQHRKEAQQQKAMSYLTSGVTPEDVQYRRSQQTMANEGSFLRGETPTAQFSQLAGAQQGPAAFGRGPSMPTTDPNAGGKYAGYSAVQFGNQVNAANNQANPWLAGITTALNGYKAASAAK